MEGSNECTRLELAEREVLEPLASRTFDRLQFVVRYSGLAVCSSVVLGNWSLYRVFELVLFSFSFNLFKLNYRVLSFLVLNYGDYYK